MELTPGQQRLAFVVVVLALAGLGAYLLVARGAGGSPSAATSPSSASSASSTAARPAASTAPSASVPPTLLPSTAAASGAGGTGIYQWLPFTPADLSAASSTTTAFAKAYATWSYTESAAAYAASFRGLATSSEVTALEGGFSTAGLAQQRAADKQVSAGSGAIDLITAFGTGSITFKVAITNTVTSTKPSATSTSQYAVTVISSGGAWRVNNIQLSSLGNP